MYCQEPGLQEKVKSGIGSMWQEWGCGPLRDSRGLLQGTKCVEGMERMTQIFIVLLSAQILQVYGQKLELANFSLWQR